MKKALFITVMIILPWCLPGQFPIPVDSVYSFMKRNSVFRNTVNWEKTDRDFVTCIRSAKTLNDTMNCFVWMLKELNDVHTNIFINNQYYGHYNPVDSATYVRIKPLRERATSEANKPFLSLLNKEYVYVRVPAYSTYDPVQINKFGQALYDSICSYDNKKIKGFIIDLRLNGGGNMYPMLCGISSLLGNTTIGFETDMDGNEVRKWEIKDNNFIIGGYQVTDIKKSCQADHTTIPVTVLTGPMTGSSGSMTAISLKKRENTIFIGEPTAEGYTTSNGYFQFAPALFMNFATNFVADRTKQIYKKSVSPDQTIIGGDNFEDLLKDEKIKAALLWLKKYKSQ